MKGKGDSMLKTTKLNHIINVARLMKSSASYVGLEPSKMFILGYLHDIGYEELLDGEDASKHGDIGALMLDPSYEYLNEVKNHGRPLHQDDSQAMRLLNYADMHVDSTGHYLTFDERLSDIKERYGTNSHQYVNSKEIIDRLRHDDDFMSIPYDDIVSRLTMVD